MANNNKPWYVKWYVWMIVIIIIFIIIFSIDRIYMIGYYNHFQPNTAFSAGDWLGFIGVIISAVVIIGSLIASININNIKWREDKILSVKPFLYSQYKLYFGNDFYFRSNNEIHFYKITCDKLCEVNLSEGGSLETEFDEAPEWFVERMKSGDLLSNFLLMEYVLSNNGAGNALQVELRINDFPVCYNLCISKNSNIHLRFAFDFSKLKIGIRYPFKFDIKYEDINSFAKYKQTEQFSIKKEKGMPMIGQVGKESFLTIPELVD